MQHWPFHFINQDSNPVVEVDFKGTTRHFTSEEISSMILAKLRDAGKAYLGESVTDAVITVPASFNDSQRQTTKDTRLIAGLNILRILNEPTAAAVAYGISKEIPEEHQVLVSIWAVKLSTSIKDGIFAVQATAGGTHLGGKDFDICLVNHFAREFQRQHNRDLTTDSQALQRLRMACERAKQSSTSTPFLTGLI
ncbi:heat shock protein 70 [Penicillium nucicola]|uniref:heat shock protein 70 n=1 Tax=Penicillium nucicola TaxID=1850975 RepID=UPI0025459A32|nr:heat shock protein 70 [Penicillium nucicola]KAJ5751521.1 heat shock protein 70 [Penicillium nucicola]